MVFYKNKVPLLKRQTDSQRVLIKYPDYIPVIIDRCDELSKILIKQKYLVPKDVSCSHLLTIIRNNIKDKDKINSNKAMFMFCNNILIMPHDNIEHLYQKYSDKEDNYLYLYLAYENVFGN